MSPRQPWWPFAGWLLLLLLAACGGHAPVEDSYALEVSVHPGINDNYADPDVDEWICRFERAGREIYDQRDEIVAAMQIEAGMTLADIGSGTGLFLPMFSEAVGENGRVYAIDIVPEFIEHIERRVQQEGIENCEARLCTERSTELPESSIDLAFLCDVYHHFEYPHSSMQSLHHALREGGEVVLIDFERIPGESSEWILSHVRAGKAEVIAELEQVGFERVEEVDLLTQNYFLRFRKVD